MRIQPELCLYREVCDLNLIMFATLLTMSGISSWGSRGAAPLGGFRVAPRQGRGVVLPKQKRKSAVEVVFLLERPFLCSNRDCDFSEVSLTCKSTGIFFFFSLEWPFLCSSIDPCSKTRVLISSLKRSFLRSSRDHRSVCYKSCSSVKF